MKHRAISEICLYCPGSLLARGANVSSGLDKGTVTSRVMLPLGLNQLTALLKDHILIAVDLLEAAKPVDAEKVAEIEEKWYDNGDDIATFLSEANPNWTKEEMASTINEHLSLTKTEAVARLTADYRTDVETFDALYVHAVSMADAFTVGIVEQFEEQFEVDRNGEKEE